MTTPANLDDLSCWRCGVRPDDTIDASTPAEPGAVLPVWPVSYTHEHALVPDYASDLIEEWKP